MIIFFIYPLLSLPLCLLCSLTRYIIYFLSLLQIQSILDVANKIEKNGDLEGASYLREHLDEDIMQCMVDVLKVTPTPDLFPT